MQYSVIRRVDSLSFECQQCGECCSYLGQVHKIKEEMGNYCFLVFNQYTGEKTEVTVDPNKVSLFLDKGIFIEHPDACPFFRYEQSHAKGYCTVHFTRPEICRDFGCWRILILDSGGKRAGRIMGRRHLASEDAALTRLFDEHSHDLVLSCDDAAWDDKVIQMLIKAGYIVRT